LSREEGGREGGGGQQTRWTLRVLMGMLVLMERGFRLLILGEREGGREGGRGRKKNPHWPVGIAAFPPSLPLLQVCLLLEQHLDQVILPPALPPSLPLALRLMTQMELTLSKVPWPYPRRFACPSSLPPWSLDLYVVPLGPVEVGEEGGREGGMGGGEGGMPPPAAVAWSGNGQEEEGEEEEEGGREGGRVVEVGFGGAVRVSVMGVLRNVSREERRRLVQVRILATVLKKEEEDEEEEGGEEGGEEEVVEEEEGTSRRRRRVSGRLQQQQRQQQAPAHPASSFFPPPHSQRQQQQQHYHHRALLTSPLDQDDGSFPACILNFPPGTFPRPGVYGLLLEGSVVDSGGRAWTMTPEGGAGRVVVRVWCGVRRRDGGWRGGMGM